MAAHSAGAGCASQLRHVRRAPVGRGATGRGPRRGGGGGGVLRATGGGEDNNNTDSNGNNTGGNGQSAFGAALRRAQRLASYHAGEEPRDGSSPPIRARIHIHIPAHLQPPAWAPLPAPVPQHQLHLTAKQAKAKARRLLRLHAAADAASDDDGEGRTDAEVAEVAADEQGEACGLRVAVMGGGALLRLVPYLFSSKTSPRCQLPLSYVPESSPATRLLEVLGCWQRG
jgi:hypothetical protein